jgi:hypothetical protein
MAGASPAGGGAAGAFFGPHPDASASDRITRKTNDFDIKQLSAFRHFVRRAAAMIAEQNARMTTASH